MKIKRRMTWKTNKKEKVKKLNNEGQKETMKKEGGES